MLILQQLLAYWISVLNHSIDQANQGFALVGPVLPVESANMSACGQQNLSLCLLVSEYKNESSEAISTKPVHRDHTPYLDAQLSLEVDSFLLEPISWILACID